MELLEEILRRIKPSPQEEEELGRVSALLLERTRRACEEEGVGKPMLVGSAARGTWLRGEKDIDVFVLFPERMPRRELEEVGLRIGRKVSEGRGVERYAEHPFVSFEFQGFQVDLVPCYDVPDPSRIKSAVDRSPHHQRYVSSRLTPGLRDQVLLLKQFMKGIGVYGAELKVHGFSGYLCELLVLHFGSFLEVLRAASSWKPGEVIDPLGRYPDPGIPRRLFEGEPLIFIDPVDPGRNVAASVSLQSLAVFVRACQDFLREPSQLYFFPRPVRPLTDEEIEELVRARGTRLLFLLFELPDVVPDVLYPQLRKAERAFVSALGQAGHRVVRSEVLGEGTGLILLEVLPCEDKMEVREGPPLGVDAHNFIRAYLRSPAKLAGPFIDGQGRVLYELRARRASPEEVVRRVAGEPHLLGKHVGESISRGYRLATEKELREVLRLEGVREFLSEYLTRCLPWYR